MDLIKVNPELIALNDQKIYTDTMFVADYILKRKPGGFKEAIKIPAKKRHVTPSSINSNITRNLILERNDWDLLEKGFKNAKDKIVKNLSDKYPNKKTEIEKLFSLFVARH